jgi:outer membrane receptor protein involved in Fe transport
MVLLGAAFAHGQSISGKIVGMITDATGAMVPRATIEITNEGTGAVRHLVADDAGNYVAAELPVGFYIVKVEAPGLATSIQKHVKVDVAADTRVDVALAAAGVTQTVTVTEEAPQMERDSAALAEVISNRQVDLLPLNGRDFRKLTFLIPGAEPRTPRGSFGSFSVNGQREKSNIFLIDGVDNNDSFRQQPSFNQGGVANAPATLFPVDALGEFSVQSQGSAEYGRNSGAVLNIVIKSGTNEMHGSAYEFIRNDAFDAKNFFELPIVKKGPFKNNDFGGVVGGPILHNKTFFFGGYEGQRERVTSPFAVKVPSASDIAAATPSGGINPLSVKILALFPPENVPGAKNNLASFSPNQNDDDNFLVKIDHHFSERFSLNGRYVFGQGNQNFPLSAGAGSPLAPYQTVVPTRVQLAGINFTQSFSSSFINETRLGYNRFKQLFFPFDAAFDPASIGLITGAMGLPTITVGGLVSLGASATIPRGRVSSGFQFVDNITKVRGAHTFKWGGEWRQALIASFNDVNSRGRINFANLSDFLAGKPSANGTTILRGATRRDTYTNNFGLFAQDDWKLSPRLTVNLGLRYDYLGRLQDRAGRLTNFIPTLGLLKLGDPGLPNIYNADKNNFAPRLGFAYDPWGHGKTVVRGSLGVYYDTPSQDFFLLQAFDSGGVGNIGTNPVPGFGTFNVMFTSPPPWGSGVDMFSTATTPSCTPTTPCSLFAVDQNLRTPYIYSYTLNVQQSLGASTVLQVSYVGSAGHKLFRTRDINQATPGGSSGRQRRRPFFFAFPQFSFIDQLEASANSNYNAFETYLRQRMRKGLTLYVGYTFAKSIDDASNGLNSGTRGLAFPQDSTNPRAERALSSHDIRHRFTFNFVYDFPFLPSRLASWPKRLTEGWQISSIYTLSSGLPATPFFGSIDISGTGELDDRPNLVGDPTVPGPVAANPTCTTPPTVVRDPSSWFNPCAFAQPAAGTFGNAGRNIIIGPRTNILDLALDKTTSLTERFKIQFRSEFFNILNHPNFTLPNVQVDGGRSFTTINSTPDVAGSNPRLGDGGPRVIQFALKLLF